MKKKELHIIVNPKAGNGRTLKIMPQTELLIKEMEGFEFAFHYTQGKMDATAIARTLIKSGAELIVAAGGDGTVNEVINGFFDENGIINPDCKFGILRCGTGQGTALSLKIPSQLKDQLSLLASPFTSCVDICKISFYDFNESYRERYFISESQVGIGSAIAADVHNGYKFLGGKLAFGIVSLKHALTFKPQQLTISVDDKRLFSGDFIGVAVGNGSLTAGGMQLTPGAKPDDGFFNILIIHQMGFFSRMSNFAKIYSGSHIRSPMFTYTTGKNLRIDTGIKIILSADGEVLGKTPCSIAMIPAALKVKSPISQSRLL